jgi:tetratricopeptide (TPR) repeat protein
MEIHRRPRPRLNDLRLESVGRHRWHFLSLPLALPLAGALLLGDVGSARALVPYVYVPREEELRGAGLGIAQAATRLLRLGQAEEAARLAELTVRLLPEDPRGWVLLAEANLRSERTEQARNALGRAKQLDPDNAGIWFAEGSLALRSGKPAEAISLLRRGLQLDGRNPSAYFDLGNAQILLDDPRAALRSFEKASDLRKDFWEAINNQGLVLYEVGNRGEAIRRWRQVLRIKPDVAETSLALAAGLHAGNPTELDEPLKLAEAALDEEPNYVLESFQKEQLWGEKLRAATRRLLLLPELRNAVERAMANATAADGGTDLQEEEDSGTEKDVSE